MKGWLDNYNDSKASAPEGFRGDGYSNVGRNYSPAWGGQFQNGGKMSFEEWYKTVPKTKNDTINYNLRRAYELAPQKELDAFVKNPNAHLMTAYENPETGIYEFMKSKNHSTIQKELDFYNGKSKQSQDFRNKYNLDTTGDFYRYVPRKMAMGGVLPGAAGHMYARVGAPSNGKYAKHTLASAKYGKIIKDDLGQWAHPGEITEINSPYITMKGVDYPVLGISDEGDVQMMYPDEEYEFIGDKVTEYPMAKNGVNQQDEKSLQQLDQLTNFTNYNTKQPGGWLDNL